MKKEILIPALLQLLGLIFIIINVIVYFSKGNTWLISKKLKMGAMILSLTALFGCGSSSNQNNEPTCYITPSTKYTDSINKEKQKQDSILNAENQKNINDSIAKGNKKPHRVCYKYVHDKQDSLY